MPVPRVTSASSPELLDIPCACAATRRAARALTQLYDDYLREHGIEAAQFALLSAIAGLGPCRQAEVGRALALDKTTLSRNVGLLARAGWLDSTGEPGSGTPELIVTADGRRVLAAARPAWQAAQAAVRALIGPGQWREAHAALRVLTSAAREVSARRRHQQRKAPRWRRLGEDG